MKEMNPIFDKIKPSKGFEILKNLDELRMAGQKVYAFNLGEPCFDTPKHIVQAAIDALEQHKTRYVAVNGIEPLRNAIVDKLRIENNLNYLPCQIIVSTGAKQVIYNALNVLVSTGDEILLLAPYWESYEQLTYLVDAKPVVVNCHIDNGYLPRIEDIEKAITPKTKLLMLNSPNNPTGAVYPKELLLQIADLVIKHDLYLIADEMYEKLVYNTACHHSIVSLNPDLYERCVVVNGVSKSYAMTGWRLGYGAGPQEIIRRMGLLQAHSTSNTSTPVQYAALEAIKGPQDDVEYMRNEYYKRYELAYHKISAIKNLKVGKVEGAFYLMVDASYYLGGTYRTQKVETIEDFCLFLLQDKHVAISPGTVYCAPTSFRISYAGSLSDIDEGLDKLAEYLNEYNCISL